MFKFIIPFLLLFSFNANACEWYNPQCFYQKNLEICLNDDFFIDEMTVISSIPLLLITGFIGIGIIQTSFPEQIPNFYNLIHENICGSKIDNKTITYHIDNSIKTIINFIPQI